MAILNCITPGGTTRSLNLDNVVLTTGNQTIGGAKTFNGDVTINADLKPMYGITMTGRLKGTSDETDNFTITTLNNTGMLYLTSNGVTDNTEKSAHIKLFGSAYGGGYNGIFEINAYDKKLRGNPDGTLTWCGNNVLTSSDIANVVLTTGNQTINGIKTFGSKITMSSDEGRIEHAGEGYAGHMSIYGGSGYTTGGFICVYGKNHASYPGQFRLTATDGTSSRILVGKPDGTLTWDGQAIGKYGYVGQSGSGTTNPWYKMASYTVPSAANNDIIAVFYVYDTYNNHYQGIFKVHVRFESASGVNANATEIQWLSNCGYDPANFVLAYSTGTTPTIEVWTKVDKGYCQRRFSIISEGTRAVVGDLWTLYKTFTAGSQSAITSGYTQKASFDNTEYKYTAGTGLSLSSANQFSTTGAWSVQLNTAKGTAPSSNLYKEQIFYDNSGNGTGAAYRFTMIGARLSTGNETGCYMTAYNPASGATAGATIGVYYPSGGTPYTAAPTPTQTDDSTKIATTAYVKDCVPKSIGSATQPVYTNANGVITKCTYTLSKSVPSDAVFTDHTYSNFVKSGSTAAAGLVPKPSTTAGTTHYLREDGTWTVPPDTNTTYSAFVKSGSTAAAGLVPKPPTTAGTTKYLREDGTWQVPPDNNTTYSAGTAALLTTGTDTTNRVWTAKILSDFVESKCTPGSSIAANGYVKLDSGLIIQWGKITPSATNNQTSATLPISFTTACYSAVASGNAYSDAYNISTGCTKTTITVGHGSADGGLDSDYISWIAVGK